MQVGSYVDTTQLINDLEILMLTQIQSLSKMGFGFRYRQPDGVKSEEQLFR